MISSEALAWDKNKQPQYLIMLALWTKFAKASMRVKWSQKSPVMWRFLIDLHFLRAHHVAVNQNFRHKFCNTVIQCKYKFVIQMQRLYRGKMNEHFSSGDFAFVLPIAFWRIIIVIMQPMFIHLFATPLRCGKTIYKTSARLNRSTRGRLKIPSYTVWIKRSPKFWKTSIPGNDLLFF